MNEDYEQPRGGCALWLLVGIILLLVFIIFQSHQQHKEAKQQNTELLEVLAERNHLDSLYREHLEQCSFISKKEVAIDSRGYFYSTYRNNPKLTK